MAKRLSLLSLLWILLLCNTSFSGPGVYAPHHYSRPSQESVFVEGSGEEFIRFWWNTGDGAVNIQEDFLEMISPEAIEALEGFTEFKNVKLTFYSYELRNHKVLDRVEELLALGLNVEVVVDGKNHREIEMPTDEVWESWSDSQQAYFVASYDSPYAPDKKVDRADLAIENSRRFLAIEALKRLTQYRRKYKGQVSIIQSPNEVVPVNEKFNYPRNHHFKGATLRFREKPRSQKWTEPVWFWTGSSNFTDGGMDRKIEASKANKEAYVAGESFKVDPKSEGHIQFGALFGEAFTDPEAMAALMGPIEKWTYAYRRGRHYDSVSLPEDLFPRVVFEDGTSVQAFFSEGQRLDGSRTIDPVKVVERILSRDDIEIEAYYNTQFVFTHHGHARHLRTVLNRHKPKNFYMAVDSSQALEDYSALPTMLFAPVVNDAPGTFEGRALEEIPELAEELAWAENVIVYRGGIDLHQRENDKLHSKTQYFRYKDSRGVQTCVVYFGSGNQTYNVSKLSSDAMYLVETTNMAICDELEAYFEGLRSHPRFEAFDAAYLERQIKKHFHMSKSLENPRFYRRVADFFHGNAKRKTLNELVKNLEAAGAQSLRAKIILRLLKWHQKYRADLKDFGWVDFHLIMRISDPERLISEELAAAIFTKWSEGIAKPGYAKKSFHNAMAMAGKLRTIDSNKREASTGDYLEDAKRRLADDCRGFMSAIRSDGFQRQRHDVAKSKSKGRKKK